MANAPLPAAIAPFLTNRSVITVQELQAGLGLSRGSARVYLSKLAGAGKVEWVSRGRYSIAPSEPLTWELPSSLQELGTSLSWRLVDVSPLIWGTELFAPFSHYATGRSVSFVEVPTQYLSMALDTLIQTGKKPILLPKPAEMSNVISLIDEPLFLIGRSEKYGAAIIDGYRVPYPERALVDLYYLLTRRSFPFAADEFGRIIYNMLEQSSRFNYQRCLRYASRRRLRDEFLTIFFRLKQEYPELDIPANLFVDGDEIGGKIDRLIMGAKV